MSEGWRKVQTPEERIRDLETALKEVYFWLGPPQPALSDPVHVVGLVQWAMAERDRLRGEVRILRKALETETSPTDTPAELDGLERELENCDCRSPEEHEGHLTGTLLGAEQEVRELRTTRDRLLKERTPLIEALEITALPGEPAHEPCREIARLALNMAANVVELDQEAP